MNIFKVYNVFASKALKITVNIFCGFLGALNLLLVYAFQVASNEPESEFFVVENTGSMQFQVFIMQLIFGGTITIILNFADYFLFAGIAARHTGIMGYIRSSLKGEQLLSQSIVGDFIISVIRTFLVVPFVGIVGTALALRQCTLQTVVSALSVWGVMLFTITVMNLLCRAFVRSLMSMVAFIYLGIAIFCQGAFIVGVFVSGASNIGFNPVVAILITAVLLCLAIVFFILGKKDVIKGYRSGFEDKV